MKNLLQFVNEGRKPGSKNKPKDGQAPAPEQEEPELKELKGQDAEENGSDGVYEIEPPTDDDITKGLDFTDISKNQKRIAMRLSGKKPFFVQGEAGWGKTSIITDVAHKFGYTVITVYLDKCEATDLAGIPVPKQSKRGADFAGNLLPAWAKVIWDNPKTKFLLFFDEMNQAAPDVMNALMPIVLRNVVCGKKFDNMLVAAAGNFEHENKGGISKLSAPLLSRFGGVITWQTGDWASVFRHLKKKWGDKLDDTIFEKLENSCTLFKNPRDVESFIIDYMLNIKDNKYAANYDAEDYLNELELIAQDDLSRTGKDQLAQLADDIFSFVNNKMKKEEKKGRNKNRQMIPENVADALKTAIINGYMEDDSDGKVRRYGISKENIMSIELDPETINAEMLERFIDTLETDGIKFKYQTDAEWKKAGYEDPQADLIITKNIKKQTLAGANKKSQPKRSIKDYVNK